LPNDSEFERSFRLRLDRLANGDWRALLAQRVPQPSAEQRAPRYRPIATVWGLPFEAARPAITRALRECGHSLTVLGKERDNVLGLAELPGVRLSVTLLAVKPLRKVERITTIVAAVDEMSREEVLYWYAKCQASGPDGLARRARHALRVLLARD
jgi:hypothetical protein